MGCWSNLVSPGITGRALIAYAQRTAGRRRPRYSNSLRSVNYPALGVNGFFILLHLAQTHLWYDGLAQDVSIWSALGSVVVMLVWVLLMENPRRGLFFGKRIGFPRRLTEVARRYHGYYFAWAIAYTFWYHPMEATSGHLIGFLYMFLLMLQGSLLFTRAHVNRWWTLVLEVAVLAHGTLGVCRIGRTEEAKECWSGLRSDYRLHESMLSQIVG